MTCCLPGSVRPLRSQQLHIAELISGDTATVLAVFEGLSAHSRYLRFQTGVPYLPNRTLRWLADVQSGRHVVHVAFLRSRPVGLVRWIRFPGNPPLAEIAVEVVDDVQGRGIGRSLVAHAARSALAAGIDDFLAYVSAGNRLVRDWAGELGAVADPDDAGALRMPVAPLALAAASGQHAAGRRAEGIVLRRRQRWWQRRP